jgi:methionyl-tRNA formyltransferase
MRVVIACGDGVYHRALCARIARDHELAGVIVYSPPNSRGSVLSRMHRRLAPGAALEYARCRWRTRHYERSARALVEQVFFFDGQPPAVPPGIPVLRVDNINAQEAVAALTRSAPDVLCVDGMNLLRQPMLDLIPRIRHGIINLHTGLSPYSQGGNCNLFMLLEGRPELVGATVHHIDAGIDSGDIIVSARPDLEASDTYERIEAKTFRLGADLMLAALRQLAEGRAERVRQWEEGKLFLRRTGYVYDVSLRVRVNELLAAGLVCDYLADRPRRDSGVRLIGMAS